MLDTRRTLDAALSELGRLDASTRPSVEDLIALSTARDHVEALFQLYTDQVSADPAISPMWEAISSAIAAQTKTPKATRARARGIVLSDPEAQVAAFWDAYADRFTWDFLPMDFLYGLYRHWMAEHYPKDAPFTARALTRRLKATAGPSSGWTHARCRPRVLLAVHEPLAARVPEYRHDGTDAAIYGFRRTRRD